MSAMASLLLLVALSLCSLVQGTTTDIGELRTVAMGIDALTCDKWDCKCAFDSQPTCCCGANDLHRMEDTLYLEMEALYGDIYKFKMEVQKLTTARKIAFHARMVDDNDDSYITDNDGVKCFGPSSNRIPVPFREVLLNDGHGYNPVLGVFTAPASGVYQFTFTIASNNEITGELKHRVVLLREGEAITAVWEQNTDDPQDSASQEVVLELLVGNQVYLELQDGQRICTSFKSNMFSGFILYPLMEVGDGR